VVSGALDAEKKCMAVSISGVLNCVFYYINADKVGQPALQGGIT